jgi:hypothetical protein
MYHASSFVEGIMGVSIGNREVVSAGSVVVEGDNIVTLRVEDLAIALSFEDPGGSADVRGEPSSDKRLQFRLINFDGLGTAYDAQIGTLHDRPLIMALWVSSLQNQKKDSTKRFVRLLSYTFSIGEGWTDE